MLDKSCIAEANKDEQEQSTENNRTSNHISMHVCHLQCVVCPKQLRPIYLDTDVFIERYLLSSAGTRHRISNPMFRVLCAFYEHKAEVVSRKFLLAYGWGVHNKVTNNVTVAISELRALLRNQCNLEIITVHGKGYQMVNKSGVISR